MLFVRIKMNSLILKGMSEICKDLAKLQADDILRIEGKLELTEEYNFTPKIKTSLIKSLKEKKKFKKSFLVKAEVFKKLSEVNKDE